MVIVKVGNVYYPVEPSEILAIYKEGNDVVIRFKDLSKNKMKMPATSELEAQNALEDVLKKISKNDR